MRIFIIAAAALLLSGCASTPQLSPSPSVPVGRYADYHALITDQMTHMGWTGVPAQVQQDLRACVVTMTMENITPTELVELDAYARGEAMMSEDRFNTLTKRVNGREGATPEAMTEAASRICPDTITALDRYSGAPDFKTTYVP